MQQEQSLNLEERKIIEKFRQMRKEHIMPKNTIEYSEDEWEKVFVSDESGKPMRVEELAAKLCKDII